jgi:DNA-binding MarR family transcriptional regulator
MNSVFDPNEQDININLKILAVLDRINEALRVTLWKENKKYEISPIQLKILMFLLFHDQEYRSISCIADEFNISKSSISDSVKTLESKMLVKREKNTGDLRVLTISLTEKGTEIAIEASKFAKQIEKIISEIPEEKQVVFLDILMDIVHKLLLNNIIKIQRMCLACNYFKKNDNSEINYCSLLKFDLKPISLRIDCPHFEVRV